MGRFKTNQERLKKQLDSKDNAETKELQVKGGFRPQTVKKMRDRHEQSKFKNDLINGKFSQLTIPQKKG